METVYYACTWDPSSQELYFPDAHLTDIIEILDFDISDPSNCNVADQYKSMDADARNCCNLVSLYCLQQF